MSKDKEVQHAQSVTPERDSPTCPNHGYKTELYHPQPVRLVYARNFFAPPGDKADELILQRREIMRAGDIGRSATHKTTEQAVIESKEQAFQAVNQKNYLKELVLPPSKRVKISYPPGCKGDELILQYRKMVRAGDIGHGATHKTTEQVMTELKEQAQAQAFEPVKRKNCSKELELPPSKRVKIEPVERIDSEASTRPCM
jgi:hypothetical protein